MVLLAMMTLPFFSQNTTKTISVKKTTLKKIIKDKEKCDSMRVAYYDQKETISDLIQDNFSMHTDLKQSRAKRENAELQLAEINKDYAKQSKKAKRSKFAILTAGVLGAIVGIIITK